MTAHIVAIKVWQRALKENNRLILQNVKMKDIEGFALLNGWKTVKMAWDKLPPLIIRMIDRWQK